MTTLQLTPALKNKITRKKVVYTIDVIFTGKKQIEVWYDINLDNDCHTAIIKLSDLSEFIVKEGLNQADHEMKAFIAKNLYEVTEFYLIAKKYSI